jgi:hypothetical protein
MVIIKLFSCDLQIILLFYIYSSTKSILLTGNIARAVLVKLQCLHHPSFIIQCHHYVNVKIQASLWFKRTCNHLWNSSVTKREKRWMIPIVTKNNQSDCKQKVSGFRCDMHFQSMQYCLSLNKQIGYIFFLLDSK